MTNYTKTIDMNELNELINQAEKHNVSGEFWEGSLVDNHLFYNDGVIEIDGLKFKYIIVKEVYLNANSSCMHLIGTDDDVMVNEWADAMNDADSVACVGCGQVLRYGDMTYVDKDTYICGECDAHICPRCDNLIYDEPCDYCAEQRRIEIYNRQCDYIDWYNSRM